jgi:hypothetical protein
MISEHNAESLALYLGILRYKHLTTKVTALTGGGR